MSSRFYYDDITLDRAHHLRMDDNWLSSNLGDDAMRIIPVWRNQSLIITNGNAISRLNAAILSGNAADIVRKNTKTLVFLGIKDDIIYYAADLSHIEDPHSTILPKGTSFKD